jgi:hypothetical protein
MRSYKSLIFISKLFKFLAYFNLISCLLVALWILFAGASINNSYEQSNAMVSQFAILIGIIVLGFIFFVFWLALSQIIMLMVNVADDMFSIATNVYALATKEKIQEDQS